MSEYVSIYKCVIVHKCPIHFFSLELDVKIETALISMCVQSYSQDIASLAMKACLALSEVLTYLTSIAL